MGGAGKATKILGLKGLDDDRDEEKLRQRPLGEIHSSLSCGYPVKDVLEGPDIQSSLMEVGGMHISS